MTDKLLTERHLEFPKLERGLYRLVCVYTCQNATLLEITCRGSNDVNLNMFMFCSLSNYAETHHEIPESVIWNWLVDLLMVS